jgi:zinc finger SWIM domain-containing protein 3
MKPVVGMSFDSIKSVKEFYKSYAHKVGFSVRINPQHLVIDEVVSKKFLCSRQGFKKTNVAPTAKQKNSTETRCGCDVHISVKLGTDKRYFIVSVVEEHNHILLSPN